MSLPTVVQGGNWKPSPQAAQDYSTKKSTRSPSIILRRKYMQTHVPKGIQGGIWTFPQWLKIFEPRIVPCLTLREKYMQTRVPTMVQGGRALHTSYMYM